MRRGGELAWIEHLRTQAGGGVKGPLRLGIGDDCAVLRPRSGHDVLVTTDFSLEGVHFRRDWHPPSAAGHRCLARGLSDLAAMGAVPLAAFLSLALPAGLRKRAAGKRWLDGFTTGLLALAAATGTPLAGGDTATAPADLVLVDIVLLGSAPRGKELRRSGARPGDRLYVTGCLGGSAAELEALARQPARFRQAAADGAHPHLFPQPRLLQGQYLSRHGTATAAIDLSDGLSTDLHHLCQASGVGALLLADQLPLHQSLQLVEPKKALQMALHGGEDYELLFTAPGSMRVPARIAGVPVRCIGSITREKAVMVQLDGKLQFLRRGGWEHAV